MSDPSCQIPHSWLSCYIACAFWQWSQPLRPWNPSMSTWTFLFSLYWSLTWTLFSLFSITAWQSSLWTIVDLVYFWLCQGQKDYYQHLIYFQTIFKESILFQIKVTLMASWMPDWQADFCFEKRHCFFGGFFPHIILKYAITFYLFQIWLIEKWLIKQQDEEILLKTRRKKTMIHCTGSMRKMRKSWDAAMKMKN